MQLRTVVPYGGHVFVLVPFAALGRPFLRCTEREVGLVTALIPARHVVQLYGLCVDAPDGVERIVMEFCAFGTLTSLLRHMPRDRVRKATVYLVGHARGIMPQRWFVFQAHRLQSPLSWSCHFFPPSGVAVGTYLPRSGTARSLGYQLPCLAPANAAL